MTKPLTNAERLCLARIAASQERDVVLSSGSLIRGLCGGERLPFTPNTYLRLVGDGRLEFIGPRRLRVTARALEELGE